MTRVRPPGERPHTMALLAALTQTPQTAQELARAAQLTPTHVRLALQSLIARGGLTIHPSPHKNRHGQRYTRLDGPIPPLRGSCAVRPPHGCRRCQGVLEVPRRRTLCHTCREVSLQRRIAHLHTVRHIPAQRASKGLERVTSTPSTSPTPYLTPIRARALGQLPAHHAPYHARTSRRT